MLLNFKLLGQVSTLRNDQLSQPTAVPKSHCQFVKLVGQWGMNCLSESKFCYPCTWGLFCFVKVKIYEWCGTGEVSG